MRIVFDRGTLLFAEAAPDAIVATLAGALWDLRVSAYRCPARHHEQIVALLLAAGVRFVDDVPAYGALP